MKQFESLRRPSAPWLRRALALSAFTAWATIGCQATNVPPQLSSLRRSGQVSFVCIGPDQRGAPLDRCPAGPRLNDGGLMVGTTGYELHALVTQTVSAEVAVVRVTGKNGSVSAGRVLDVDSTNPGVTPLRVGQKPVDIVTTPGGQASFVGVAEVGKEGIFALPTSCIFEPQKGEQARDLTTWAGCSLPSAPGEMVILVDPADAEGRVRTSCSGSYDTPNAEPGAGEGGEGGGEGGSACPADLSDEGSPAGRRKLLVTLPDEGKIVVLDAQALLNRAPGSFAACEFEAEHTLEVRLPSRILQPLPADMVVEGCSEPVQEYGPFAGPFSARPAGLSERDGMLAIADGGAPVIHWLDARNPCELEELDPLVATSFNQPNRVVTTSKVAISPLAPGGRRYVYAIDDIGEKVASVMVFDVSEGQRSRTPLVRPGSTEMPLEPPDRIEFVAPAKDVTFALVDRPEIDELTGTAAVGTRCNPDPSIGTADPEARYRPNLDDETGARPNRWRGLFGYVLLGNGSLAVVDIDDFDAACRRPARLNPSSQPDFRGCSDDPTAPAFYTADGGVGSPPTVTDEVSCRVVEPHRARSAQLMITSEDSGALAPSLRSFARLTQAGRGIPVSRALPTGRTNPIMLGVDFEGATAGTSEPAEVFIGNQRYGRNESANFLDLSPRSAEQPHVVLPFTEPRAYPNSEVVSVTYEGDLDGLQRTGVLRTQERVLEDLQASFCEMGVQSVELTAEVGESRFGLRDESRAAFGTRHADYVQVASALRDEEDPYWDAEGRVCGDSGGDTAELTGFAACDGLFGDADADDLFASRDFRILRAYQDRLEIEPRFARGEAADRIVDMLHCCFPGALSYNVRAGKQWVVKGAATGFRHSVRATPVTVDGKTEYLCVRDCSPHKAGEQGRAFEVSSTNCANPSSTREDYCAVGPRTPDDLVCAYDAERGPVTPDGVAAGCIFAGQTRRFVVYRGLLPSERGMSFGFEVAGGFQAQTVALTDTNNNAVLPVSLVPVPSFGQLAVVDSQNRGLMMIDLRTARVADAFY